MYVHSHMPKDKRIEIRINASDYKHIANKAQKEGISVSEYIRRMALEK